MVWGKRLSRIFKTTQRINQLLTEHKMQMKHTAGVYTLTSSDGIKELSTMDIRKVDSFLTEKSQLTAQITFDNIESR